MRVQRVSLFSIFSAPSLILAKPLHIQDILKDDIVQARTSSPLADCFSPIRESGTTAASSPFSGPALYDTTGDVDNWHEAATQICHQLTMPDDQFPEHLTEFENHMMSIDQAYDGCAEHGTHHWPASPIECYAHHTVIDPVGTDLGHTGIEQCPPNSPQQLVGGVDAGSTSMTKVGQHPAYPSPVSNSQDHHTPESKRRRNNLFGEKIGTSSVEVAQFRDPPKFFDLIKPNIRLSLASYPQPDIIGKTLISKSIGSFKQDLETLDEQIRDHYMLRRGKRRFQDISACEVPLSSGDLMICLTKSKGKLLPFENLVAKLTNLLESVSCWFVIVFATEKTLLKSIRSLYVDLFDWLWKQFFQPEKSFPVVGSIKKSMAVLDRSAFGPIQRYLVDHLVQEQADRQSEVDVLALWLIGMWLKSTSPGSWNELYSTDKDFWRQVTEKYNSYELVQRFNKPTFSTTTQSLSSNRWLKGLEIAPDFGRVLYKDFMGQGSYTTSIAHDELCAQHSSLSAHIERVYDPKVDLLWGKKTLHFDHLDVCAVFLLVKENEQRNTHTVRLFRGWKLRPVDDIKKKVWKLMERIALIHTALIQFAKQHKWNVKDQWRVDFFDWFVTQLCSPEGSFPVIGNVNVKGPIQPSMKSSFGLIQAYMIQYMTIKLGSPHSYQMKAQETASTMLAYWYKTRHPEFWAQHFQNHNSFWYFLDEFDKLSQNH